MDADDVLTTTRAVRKRIDLGRPVPVHVFPCLEGRSETLGHAAAAAWFGSVVPATWSFMLAARGPGGWAAA